MSICLKMYSKFKGTFLWLISKGFHWVSPIGLARGLEVQTFQLSTKLCALVCLGKSGSLGGRSLEVWWTAPTSVSRWLRFCLFLLYLRLCSNSIVLWGRLDYRVLRSETILLLRILEEGVFNTQIGQTTLVPSMHIGDPRQSCQSSILQTRTYLRCLVEVVRHNQLSQVFPALESVTLTYQLMCGLLVYLPHILLGGQFDSDLIQWKTETAQRPMHILSRHDQVAVSAQFAIIEHLDFLQLVCEVLYVLALLGWYWSDALCWGHQSLQAQLFHLHCHLLGLLCLYIELLWLGNSHGVDLARNDVHELLSLQTGHWWCKLLNCLLFALVWHNWITLGRLVGLTEVLSKVLPWILSLTLSLILTEIHWLKR